MPGPVMGRSIAQSPPKCRRRRFCLMSPPPRGNVHMATDNAHYEDLND